MPRLSLSFRLIVCLACTLLLAVAVPPSYAVRTHRAPKQVRQQIDDLEEQWKAATLSNDAVLMDHLLSDDYVGISWNGQVNTKATQLNRVRNRALVISRLDLSDIKVKVFGPVAIVTSSVTLEGTNEGNPLNGVFRYTRVYQRLPGGLWKITNFEATRVPDHHDGTGQAAFQTP